MKQTSAQDVQLMQRRLQKAVKKRLGKEYDISIEIQVAGNSACTMNVFIWDSNTKIKYHKFHCTPTTKQLINWINGLPHTNNIK